MMNVKKGLTVLLVVIALTSCVSVKPYQKMYLNDEEMDLGVKSSEGLEVSFQSYREGASGASGGKVGGGCGCN